MWKERKQFSATQKVILIRRRSLEVDWTSYAPIFQNQGCLSRKINEVLLDVNTRSPIANSAKGPYQKNFHWFHSTLSASGQFNRSLAIRQKIFGGSIAVVYGGFGYTETDGPHTWNGTCRTGKRQSPIAIQASAVVWDQSLPRLNFVNYQDNNGSIYVENNGHTCKRFRKKLKAFDN